LGFIGLLGYMYNAPILYNNTFQLPLNSSLGYFLLGISFFCLGGSNTFFTKPFFGTTPSASLLRIFLPLIIAGIIVESLVFIYLHNNDILSPAISMAIITIISILLTTVALTVVSKYVVKRADIAEKARKTSEVTVLKERILMRTLIDNLPDTIYVKDIHARKILANKADIIAVGLDKESDILGKTDLEVFSEEDGAHGYSQDIQVISTGQAIINHEKEYLDSSGNVKWLRTSKIPLKDLDGKIVGLVGIGHDITAAKEVEAQMLLLTHTLKSLNDCVSITDIHDKIIYVNDSFLNTYGYSKEELIGENIRIVRKKDAIEEISENILPATILSGWHGEIVNCKKDGTEFHVEISTSPVLNEAGEIIALSGIAIDITERKKMEDALEKSRERYRTLVENQGEGIVIADKNEVVTFA
ncbi:MAG: PAS domain-containing protein, partial [Ignavibacteria bacterium]|nr:PAS domain-containing protein [Ignavibacteria bacterium]